MMNTCRRVPKRILEVIVYVATSPEVLNCIAPFSYMFALFGIAGWGILRAIPYLYSDYDIWMTTAVQCIGWFLAVELFINWLCLRFVGSTYDPAIHGAPSVLLNTGIPVYEENEYYNIHKPRKDATSVRVNSNYLDNTNMEITNTRPHSLVDKSVMGYFTWTHCIPCNRPNPPRAHHCVLCNTCILKRDHHCYVAATCVGYRNLRYFSTFLFYAVLATIFAMVHALPYAYYKVIPNVVFYDLFYPITIVRGILGYVGFRDFFLIILGWMLLIYLIFSSYSLFQVYKWITTGNTSFELNNNMDIYDSRNLSGKVRAVYGHYWLWNFLLPMHFIFEPIDDPIRWQSFRRNDAYFLS